MQEVNELPRPRGRPFFSLIAAVLVAFTLVATVAWRHRGSSERRIDQLLLRPAFWGKTFDDRDPQTGVLRSWRFDQALLNGHLLSQEEYARLYEGGGARGELRLIASPAGRYAASYEAMEIARIDLEGQ